MGFILYRPMIHFHCKWDPGPDPLCFFGSCARCTGSASLVVRYMYKLGEPPFMKTGHLRMRLGWSRP